MSDTDKVVWTPEDEAALQPLLIKRFLALAYEAIESGLWVYEDKWDDEWSNLNPPEWFIYYVRNDLLKLDSEDLLRYGVRTKDPEDLLAKQRRELSSLQYQVSEIERRIKQKYTTDGQVAGA